VWAMVRGARHPYGHHPMALERSQQPPAALDRAAFARLIDASLPRVYAYIANRVDDRAAAEEVTATTLRRAVEVAREEAFDADTFASFTFRVAATAVVDHARRKRAMQPHGIRAGDFNRDTDRRRAAQATTDEVAARAFAAAIDRRDLRRAIQALPDAQRRLILLRYVDALADDEQCAVLGWNRETLARRVHGALRALHAGLADEASNAA
jgi:RNA polymerase sigma-70 factor (ECF subfamily)